MCTLEFGVRGTQAVSAIAPPLARGAAVEMSVLPPATKAARELSAISAACTKDTAMYSAIRPGARRVPNERYSGMRTRKRLVKSDCGSANLVQERRAATSKYLRP